MPSKVGLQIKKFKEILTNHTIPFPLISDLPKLLPHDAIEKETAENLKNYGGFIPGVRPGRATAEYLDYVLTRITVIGSIYLVVLCLLPDFLINKFNVPFYLGGTTLLIVCNVITETVAQIQSYLISNQYQGILKNTSGKMKRRFVR